MAGPLVQSGRRVSRVPRVDSRFRAFSFPYGSNLARMPTAEEAWDEWCEQFDDVADALFQGHYYRSIWRALTAIIEQSGTPQSAGVVSYLRVTYAAYIASYVRREVDDHTDSTSLYRCLQYLARNAHAMSRTRFSAAVTLIYEEDRQDVSRWFDKFAPDGGSELDRPTIETGMRDLRNAADKVKRFVDTRVAHRGKVPSEPISFADIDAAMGVIESISKKYYGLRHPGTNLWTATPVVDLNFLRMFEVPWFPPGSTVPPELRQP